MYAYITIIFSLILAGCLFVAIRLLLDVARNTQKFQNHIAALEKNSAENESRCKKYEQDIRELHTQLARKDEDFQKHITDTEARAKGNLHELTITNEKLTRDKRMLEEQLKINKAKLADMIKGKKEPQASSDPNASYAEVLKEKVIGEGNTPPNEDSQEKPQADQPAHQDNQEKNEEKATA